MLYLIPVYCIVTAISAALCLFHFKLWAAFYIIAPSLLAVMVGDALGSMVGRGSPLKKMGRAVIAAVMLLIAFWLARHMAITLYWTYVPGLLWVMIGVLVGLVGSETRLARRA